MTVSPDAEDSRSSGPGNSGSRRSGPEKPDWRKPAGAFLILGLIGGWAFIIVSLTGEITALPTGAQIAVYAVCGILWIAPLRPLLRWMETGRWRS